MGTSFSRISAVDSLETLDLYIRYQNSNLVGEKLGISGASVRDRLRSLGVKLRPQGRSNISVEHLNEMDRVNMKRKHLREKIEADLALYSEDKRPTNLPPHVELETLELYLKHQNTRGVAEHLGLQHTTIYYRLRHLGVILRPTGSSKVRVEDVNDMAAINATLIRLKTEVAVLQAINK